MNRLLDGLRQMRQYPSALVGLALIGFLVGLAVYTVLAIPYREALDK